MGRSSGAATRAVRKILTGGPCLEVGGVRVEELDEVVMEDGVLEGLLAQRTNVERES